MTRQYPFRIAVTGPESTGKSTLARDLARRLGALWVPEFARYYLGELTRPYEESDLLDILHGQLRWEQNYSRLAGPFLFCDTDPLVIKIWSQYKYGRCHPLIESTCQTHRYDLHLLCKPDLPWTFDPLRENPDLNERMEIYNLYKNELQILNTPYVEIGGEALQRKATALSAIFSQIRP